MRASALYYAYGHTPVLSGIDLEIPPGRVTAIAGTNGAGKTTLVEILAGVRIPDSGVVDRRATVALVVQRPHVPDELPLTAGDVVALGAQSPAARQQRGQGRRARTAAVTAALDRVGASELCPIPFADLSGGQRQRVLIAQGLAVGARILLLDEPAAGLDADSRARTREILAEEARRGVAVACVTHDRDDLESADRVLWIEDGAARLEVNG